MKTTLKLFLGLVFSTTVLFNLSSILNAHELSQSKAPSYRWKTGVKCQNGGTYSICQLTGTEGSCSIYGETDPNPKCPEND